MKAEAGLLFLVALLPASPVQAVEPPSAVAVSGALPRTGALGRKELEALGASTVEWVEHGERHRVTGVPLEKVLAAFGFTPGPRGKQVPVAEKRAGWRKVLVAVGRDGYQVAFSCAEVSPEIGATKAFLSWSADGEPLREETGPFRLVVTTDGEPARAVHGLERLVVVDVTLPPERPARTPP